MSDISVEEVDDVTDTVLGHIEAGGEDVVLLHSGDWFGLAAFGRVVETDVGEIEVVPREVLGAHETGTREKLDSLAGDEDEILSFGHIVEVLSLCCKRWWLRVGDVNYVKI